MRTACLVIAYQGAAVLSRALDIYSAAGWDVFVHLDRKADSESYRTTLGPRIAHCRFIESPLVVHWGGYSTVEAEVALLEMARASGAYDRYVLVSDDSFPIHPGPRLAKHFKADLDYIEAILVDPSSPYHERYYKPYYQRYADFFFFEHPATSPRRGPKELHAIDDAFIKKIGELAELKKRGKKKIPVYWGSEFWALRPNTVEIALEVLRCDAHLRKSFEFSAISDELAFQSIIGARVPEGSRAFPMMYADFNFSSGPRIYERIEELPYDFHPHHAFIRKISPGSARLIDYLHGRVAAGESLSAFAGSGNLLSRDVDPQTGFTSYLLVLTAPEVLSATSAQAWHDVESDGKFRFRWSAATSITWTLDQFIPGPCRVRVVICFVMEAAPEFSVDCSITLEGVTRTAIRRGFSIFADFDCAMLQHQEVVLSTPQPLSPKERNDLLDQRTLGLAIRMTNVGT